MKKVDEETKRLIMDLISEQGLGISEFALEKDFIVFDVLRAMSTLNHASFDLVFCGGTCLSKAYGLLDRVSEDVDIKVVSKAGVALKGNALRSALSALKKLVAELLLSVGFDNVSIRITARDGNRYVVLDAAYGSHFEQSPAMRANMKVELNYTAMTLPPVKREIGLLFDTLADTPRRSVVQMSCVDMREALVEKMVSFPRRLALWMKDKSRDFDKTLVRHIYDVYEISTKMPEVVSEIAMLRTMMFSVMAKDATDFATQHPGFALDPVGEFENAMNYAVANPSIRALFDEFVSVMVYAQPSPSFGQALECFRAILGKLMPARGIGFADLLAKPLIEPSAF
ncbi:MAG: hypothetical protein RIR00_2423 [Pseudomonadota bacterium]|jgi:hypothetical protein